VATAYEFGGVPKEKKKRTDIAIVGMRPWKNTIEMEPPVELIERALRRAMFLKILKFQGD